MAITDFNGLLAAQRQTIPIIKTASRTSVAAIPFSVFDLAGNPGAGTLAGTSTAAGVVPTDATPGCPIINANAGKTFYLANVDFGWNVAGRLTLYDMLFKAGAYAYNANTTLSGQPSYSSRVPGGNDYKGLQIWVETVTAFTGNMSVAVTYTNQDGTAAHTTGTVATGVAPTLGRMIQLPLQAGDTGVQKIESVVGTVATVGTFNILVLRPLWSGRVKFIGDGDTHGPDKTGMPEIFSDSAIILVPTTDSTATQVPELLIDIVSG